MRCMSFFRLGKVEACGWWWVNGEGDCGVHKESIISSDIDAGVILAIVSLNVCWGHGGGDSYAKSFMIPCSQDRQVTRCMYA
jgi:hypothetical protein